MIWAGAGPVRLGVERDRVGLREHAQPTGRRGQAAAQRFVRLAGRGGHLVQLTPAVMQVFNRFLADSMSGNDLMYQLAVCQMARSREALYV